MDNWVNIKTTPNFKSQKYSLDFFFNYIFMLCLFQWKILNKNSFPYFQCLITLEKISQRKIIFGQQKKIWLIFRNCSPLIFFGK